MVAGETTLGHGVAPAAVACSLDDLCLMPKARRQPLWAPAGPTIYHYISILKAFACLDPMPGPRRRALPHPDAP